jgi:hypothetical protein
VEGVFMPRGICKGCKKLKELNSSGYCNIGNTLKGACNAESLGMAAGDKLFTLFERWATKYVSKSTLKIILAALFALVFFIYQAAKTN